MAIIDQRILIPARQEVVWAYISDFSKNTEWQADCQGVSFLSTRHDGVGTRWRSTTDRGKDAVLEITSWYNGLGYEYAVVDGVPLKNTKGRLRLQEIPEGTVVQWTFSFDGGGMLGGGRTARQYDSVMAASLKALYKQIKAINQSDDIAARSLIREAPDVEARAAYVPRHPSVVGEATDQDEDAVLLPVAGEPQVDAQDASLVAAIDLNAEPPVSVEDTKPRPPTKGELTGDERFAPKPEPAPTVVEPESAEMGAPTSSTELEPESLAAEPQSDRTAAAVAAAAAAAALPPADAHGKSIWEVFGVDRPSDEAEASQEAAPAEADQPEVEAVSEAEAAPDPQETAPLEAVPEAAAAVPAVTVAVMATVIAAVPDDATTAEPAESAQPATQQAAAPVAGAPRRGLRLVQRRTLAKVRRPG